MLEEVVAVAVAVQEVARLPAAYATEGSNSRGPNKSVKRDNQKRRFALLLVAAYLHR